MTTSESLNVIKNAMDRLLDIRSKKSVSGDRKKRLDNDINTLRRLIIEYTVLAMYEDEVDEKGNSQKTGEKGETDR